MAILGTISFPRTMVETAHNPLGVIPEIFLEKKARK
jgi:hypothetical protein